MSTFEIGLLNNSYNAADALGVAYPSDQYSFTLGDTQSFKLSLTGISTTVDWQIKDSQGTTLHSGSVSPTNLEGINIDNLSAGEYSLELSQTNTDTNYALNIDLLTKLNVESGFFTVGQTGQIGVDYLTDGGWYQGELAIFSLTGMEAFAPGSQAFIKEAARRSLTNSTQGYVVIADATEGAKFSPTFPWGDNYNNGEYKNIKTFAMKPGDNFGFMLVPNGTAQQVFDNPNIGGAKRPLFSLVTANPNEAFHVGQIADVIGDGKTFVMEDKRVDEGSDKDYNDIVFRLTGATGKAVKLDDVIAADKDWCKTKVVDDLIAYINTPPQFLQFTTKTLYKAGEAIELTDAKVYDENRDLTKVNFWLNRKEEVGWVNIKDATKDAFKVNEDWTSFNYSLRDLVAGSYELKAIAFDERQQSNEIIKEFRVNAAPKELQFSITQDTYDIGETVSITGGTVYDADGVGDLVKVGFFLKKDNNTWQDITADVTSFTAGSGDNNLANFTYSLSPNLLKEAGNYEIKGVAYDLADDSSNEVIKNFTIRSKTVEPSPNSPPEQLQFNLLPYYTIGQSVSITDGKVYDKNGESDLKSVDLELYKDNVFLNKYSVAIADDDRSGDGWGTFNYLWSDLPEGNYRLDAKAFDGVEYSAKVSQSFSVIGEPVIEPVPNSPPEFLQFNLLPSYKIGQPITIMDGKVYDKNGESNLKSVDLELYKDNVFLNKYTVAIADDNQSGDGWGTFNYLWSDLSVGNYRLEAKAFDGVEYSAKVSQSFSVISEPVIEPVPNSPPEFLQLNLLSSYTTGQPITFTNAKVYDKNGESDLKEVTLELYKDNNFLGNYTVGIVDDSQSGDGWGTFNISFNQLAEGNYQIKASAYDKANAESNKVVQSFTVEANKPPQPNRAPGALDFSILPLYVNGETLSFSDGKVYDPDGARDVDRVYFWLGTIAGEQVDAIEVTQFTPDSKGNARFDFNYDLSKLAPGRYQLWAIATDKSGDYSEPTIQTFSITSDAGIKGLSDEERLAMLDAAKLENYTPEQLAATREWVVWITPGQSSAELATAVEAQDKGATGYIPNTYIWEFTDTIPPEEVIQRLSSLPGLELSYPLVPVPTTLSSTPNDEPLVQKPGTLNPSYPVPDPNDTKLRDFLNSYQWHLRSGVNQSADANVSNAWNLAQGRGVVIGIVDDGLDFNNPDLKDRYRGDLSWDFNENNSTPSPTYNKTISLKNTPKFIRDYGQTNIYLDVPLTGVLSDVNVRLNATHAKLSDLEISLDSPNEPIFNPTIGMASSSFRRIQGGNGSGKNPVKLFGNFIGNGANLTNTIFDDQASLSIFQGTAPFTGKFRPLGTLSDFNDQWAGGTWNLRITDKALVAAGLLSNWTLDLQTYNPHGTAVAGIAAATGNNSINGSGVAPLASLAGLRLVADAVTDEQIAMALTHKNQDIDIYNNSWKLQDRLIKPALTMAAMKEGTNLGRRGLGNNYVFGAGNDEWTGGNVNYNGLANSRYAIAVAAIDHTGEQTIYSEPGAPLLVSAYSSGSGVGITTTDLMGNNGYSAGDYTNRFGGTSAAAPLVSGAIALMLEANPNLSWRDVQHILVRTAKQNDPTDLDWTTNGAGYHINHKYGFGAIDADAAVRLAKNWVSAGDEVMVSSDLQNVLENIPDGDEQTGVTSTVSINDDISIEKLEVLFDANHNDWSDLKLVLTSPDGTQSILADYISSDSNVSNRLTPLSSIWTFTSARHWGESSKGEWKLQAFDREGNQVEGKWNSWRLNIYGAKATVTVTATDNFATESGDSGQFTITRTGNTKYDLSVNYSMAGNATNEKDYNQVSNSIIIPAGKSAVTIPIIPIDDQVYEGNEAVILNLNDSDVYTLGTQSSGRLVIGDNDNPPSNNPSDIKFVDSGTLLEGGDIGSVTPGDYDSDGDIDLLLTGWGNSGLTSTIYRNDSGTFTDINASLLGVQRSAVDWGDYDNDGDLDILLTGTTDNIKNNNAKIYRNDGGNFTEVNTSLSGVQYGSVAWGDYDNDGDLDILLTGFNGRSISKVYRNDGSNTFTDINAPLVGVHYSSVAWGDYDNDGDLDILLTGIAPSNGTPVSKIYRNNSGNFIDIGASIVGVRDSSVAWGDYDNDGDIDILLTGNAGTFVNPKMVSKIYRNDNNTFTDIGASLANVNHSSVAWGDYDNDGDLDILLVGATDNQYPTIVSKVYRNDNGNFTDIKASLTDSVELNGHAVAWGDYDSDSDLDIFISGATGISRIYWNDSFVANKAPTVPTGLTTLVNTSSAIFRWNPSTDDHTPQTGMTYNLRVGTTPGGSEIMSPMASDNGIRKVVQMGNVNQNTSWTLKNLKPGTYYWSVQAIDTAFEGSAFANEGSFTIEEPKPSLEWVRQLGTSLEDWSRDVATDSAGNVYIVGSTGSGDTSTGNWDSYLAKYDSNGNLVWKQQFNDNLADQALGVKIDNTDNIYIVGSTEYDAYVAKYNTDGEEIWKRVFSSEDGAFVMGDGARGVGVDGAGNVYIAGSTMGSFDVLKSVQKITPNQDVFITKYDSDGNQLWVKDFGSSKHEYPWSMTVDSAGSIYMVGYTEGAFGGESKGSDDAFVTKYDSDGNQVWLRQFGTVATDRAFGISLDNTGNVYISGFSSGSLDGNINSGGSDSLVVKYDNSGNHLWTKQFGTTSSDNATTISIDKTGSIYLAGITKGGLDGKNNAGLNDVFITRYDSNGNRSWSDQLGTVGEDQLLKLIIDNDNNMYLTGVASGSLLGQPYAGSYDALLLKYKIR
ncbi:S8 family serine peptidase [Aerosakkonema sp. BLCC-F183]|uniref:S8 family serine peptidase n=1 Tax=Aerosakkonema sp. BLCC-F183 TaxID=3342834 RepID=UPI0035BA17AD